MSSSASVMAMQKEGQRELVIRRGKPEPGDIYCNNHISTSKYNILTLVPRSLFEQFHRVANIWFLVVSIFQVLPFQLSPTSSWATIAPLALVLSVTMAKDAYIDYCRHKADQLVNHRKTSIWNDDREDFEPVMWKNLEVANIILLVKDEPIPADIMLLATSENDGLCFVETSNLDGESNLKIKTALPETAAIFEGTDIKEVMKKVNKLDESSLLTELPNNKLYNFDGSLKMKGYPRNIAVDNKAILLRGSMLKNTKWALGFVVFTGADTKQMMNSKAPRLKRSNVERRVNRYLVIVFSVLFGTSLLSAVISVAQSYSDPDQLHYFSGQHASGSGLNFITFMILYNGLVPISLYVTMDIIRVIQARFMQWDLRMYNVKTDRTAQVKSGDLNEDLGQVEFIFSDKTGTLTENQMEFKRCYIQGKAYGYLTSQPYSSGMICENTHEKFKFYDPELYADLMGPRKKEVGEFLELLSLCHTVIPSNAEDGSLQYQSALPDEEALVIAAHCFGYSFASVKASTYQVNVHGERRSFLLMGINEFNSERKRMSVVVKPLEDPYGECILYCKGADSVMLPRCQVSDSERSELDTHLTDFASSGLRTLVLAKRVLTQEQSSEFERKWITAKNAMYERAQRLTEVAEEYEVGMQVLGVTAIEDKIQEGVPDTIAKLRDADIKIWVLTGDKQETAINIGYACRLLTKDTHVITINAASQEETKFLLRREVLRNIASTELEDQRSRPGRRTPKPFSTPGGSPHRSSPVPHATMLGKSVVEEMLVLQTDSLNLALVIDGQTLSYLFSDGQCVKYFSVLSLLCQSVICVRVSPMQKSQVVKLVKDHFAFKPLTLAIGDGANDVSMIQEAHVGIGVVGNEGMQAVNSSDYAISRFQHLLPLLFLHGRWNYQRITRVVLYSFYKNFLLVLPMFLFSFSNLYSGTALYDSWLIMSYNVGFTAFPIIILGVMDKDLSPETVYSCPRLFTSGIYGRHFNARIFLKWVLYAIAQSLLLYGFCGMIGDVAMDADGRTSSMDQIGTAAFYVVVQTATLVILILMQDWTWLFVIVAGLSVLAFYPYLIIYDYSQMPTKNLVGVVKSIYTYPTVAFIMMLTPLICVSLQLAVRYFQVIFRPTLVDKYMMREKGIRRADPSEYEIHLPGNRLIRAKQYANDLSKCFLPKKLKVEPPEETQADFNFNPKTLVFNNPHIERGFRRYLMERSITFLKLMFWLVMLFNLIWTIVDLVLVDHESSYIGLRASLAVVLLVVVILAHTRLFTSYFEMSIVMIAAIGLLVKVGSEFVYNNDGSMSTAIAPIILFVLFGVSTYKLIFILFAFLLVYMIRVSVKFWIEYSNVDMAIFIMSYSVLLCGIFGVSSFVGFVVERLGRAEYALHKGLESEHQRGQDILSNLLPSFVKEKVKQGIRYLAEEQGMVTVMFCDIYNFDNICATHDPKELTELLDGFFFLLDKLCDIHGVSKIETVNKTYMACGGLKDSEVGMRAELRDKNHAIRIIELALDILKRLETCFLKDGEKMQVKIGINSGPVVAGVVGEHKPQFSLVGATVNLASRMCSTIDHPDNMQISWNTYEFVKHCTMWSFEENRVPAKGYGEVTTYYVKNITPVHRGSVKRHTILSRAAVEALSPLPAQVSDDIMNESSTPLIDPVKRNQVQPSNSDADVTAAETKETSMEDPEDLELAGPVQWLMCTLRETTEQQTYRIACLERDLKGLHYGLWIAVSIYCIINSVLILGFILTHGVHGSPLMIALRVASNLATGVLAQCFRKKGEGVQLYHHFTFPWAVTLFYLSSSLISVLTLYTVADRFKYLVVLEVMFTDVVFSHLSGLPFGFILICMIFVLASWFHVALALLSPSNVAETTAFLGFFMSLNGAASYMREIQDRATYNLNKRSTREIQNTEKLLNQMMPPHVIRNLKQGLTPTEKYHNVTLLFADIVGFTEWSKNKKPKQVVRMLSKLFSTFDHLCVENHVYKVHTIGDCYVVLGFSDQGDDREREEVVECTNMINMGLSMIKAIRRINTKKKTDLDMRIGLHTGSISAGITGSNIVRYDIYGPDVDIANKMESTGAKGRLHVSEETKQLIQQGNPGRFDFEFDKEVTYQPTSRSIMTYFVIPLSRADLE